MILQAQVLVLVLKVMLNELLGVLLKELAPMKIARSLTTKHRNLGITAVVWRVFALGKHWVLGCN